MKHLLALGAAAVLQAGILSSSYAAAATTTTPDTTYVGYATVTGGAGGTVVTVTDKDALIAACQSPDPMIINVQGTIEAGSIVVSSNKTIIGVDTSAYLSKSSFILKGVNNIIIKNITIHFPDLADRKSSDGDMIHILDSSYNIWIDHCELYNMIGDCNGDGTINEKGDVPMSDVDHYDGVVDITRGSKLVTVSWCYIHDSYKTSLCGGSDKDTIDRQVTYHHNLFNHSHSRLPSYRGGTGHIFNNYYLNIGTSGVNSRMGATLMVESNYFENVGDGEFDEKLKMTQGPIGAYYSKEPGFYNVKDNIFVDCKGNQPKKSTTKYKPPYKYSTIKTKDVPAVVSQWAGIIGKSKTLLKGDGSTQNVVPAGK